MKLTKEINRSFILQLVCLIILLLSMKGIAYSAHHDEHHNEHHDDEPDKGQHGGRLMIDGDLAVELFIYEQGIEPRFYAWVTHKGVNINKTKMRLIVELARLGGQVDHFEFTAVNTANQTASQGKTRQQYQHRLEASGIVAEPHSFDVNIQLEYKGKKTTWKYPSYEGRISIDSRIAVEAGIKTATAAPGIIRQTVITYGKLSTDPSSLSHIHARFPGLITKVKANIGDKVKAGDVLAEIESNASLKRYTLTSPLSGVVIARHANAGESSQQQVLFTVANYQQLWAELQIFPGSMGLIAEQQTVILKVDERHYESVIKYLVPNDFGQPYINAMVPIDNRKLHWTPGLLVEGEVIVAKNKVALAVDNRALQTWRDWVVVFIKVGNEYEVRPLTLARTDGQFSEVIAGLNVGDSYVVENSYLIKADIDKSGATHDH